MRKAIAIAALLFAFALAPPPSASAQEIVVDTVTFETDVLGRPATVVITAGPERGYVGDTLRFEYQIHDEFGNSTMAVVSWSALDPARATVVSQSAGGGVSGDPAFEVVALMPGPLRLIATVSRVDSIALGWQYLGDGQPYPAGTFVMQRDAPNGNFLFHTLYDEEGQSLRATVGRMCAFFYQHSSLFLTSQGCESLGPALDSSPPVPDFDRQVLLDLRREVAEHPGTWSTVNMGRTFEMFSRFLQAG